MVEIEQSTLTISVTSGAAGTLVIGGNTGTLAIGGDAGTLVIDDAAFITGDINAPLVPVVGENAPAAEGG